MNAAVLVSAWSAAASDIYISSRFLFFLARRGHAPKIFASLVRYPSDPKREVRAEEEESEEDVLDQEDEDLPHVIDISIANTTFSREVSEAYKDYDTSDEVHVAITPVDNVDDDGQHAPTPATTRHNTQEMPDVEANAASSKTRRALFVLPLWAILGSASVGLLCFLGAVPGQGPDVVSIAYPYLPPYTESKVFRHSNGW